jgi:hypothetical protein
MRASEIEEALRVWEGADSAPGQFTWDELQTVYAVTCEEARRAAPVVTAAQCAAAACRDAEDVWRLADQLWLAELAKG